MCSGWYFVHTCLTAPPHHTPDLITTLWELDVVVFKSSVSTTPSLDVLNLFWICDAKLPSNARCVCVRPNQQPIPFSPLSTLRTEVWKFVTGYVLSWAPNALRVPSALPQWACRTATRPWCAAAPAKTCGKARSACGACSAPKRLH